MEKKEYDESIKLSLSDKKFRVLNFSLVICLLIITISFLFYFIVTGDPNKRIVPTIAMIIFTIAPYLFERMFKLRMNGFIFLFYLLYLIFAGIFGCVLNFYNISFLNLNKWYDSVIHVLAGYVFCFVGIFVLGRIENYKNLKLWTIILFAFSFTLAVELIWELFERFADVFLGQTAQGVKVEGFNAPLVTDTMVDVLCNVTGGILFIFHFIIAKSTNFSLGIEFLENEIVYKRFVHKETKKIIEKNKSKDKLEVDNILREEKKNNK